MLRMTHFQMKKKLYRAFITNCLMAGLALATCHMAYAKTMHVRVEGNHLVDENGNILLLHGVNYSGYESVAVQGWDVADPSGGQAMVGNVGGPNLDQLTAWGVNALRIPLNEDSWLALSCYEVNSNFGQPKNADPGSNYRASLKNLVTAANAAGLYVILDLHWAAPNWPNNYWGASTGTPPVCPELQSPMADKDHSLDFWTSVATTFKDNRAVMFELFNEPNSNGLLNNQDPAQAVAQGGLFGAIVSNSYSCPAGKADCLWWEQITSKWQSVGMQQMLNAVRATGARNVVLVGDNADSSDMSGWLANIPFDPINEMAATWHPYPPEEKVYNVAIVSPGNGYQVGDTITLPAPNGVYTPATVTVTGEANGQITSVAITVPGDYLYSSQPTSTVQQATTSGSGSGASFTVTQWWGLTALWPIAANWPTVAAVAEKVPLIMTEVGDHNPPGATSSPWLEKLLPWADQHGMSYLGWTWDVWGQTSNDLIKDASGTPTDGFGVYFKQHLLDLRAVETAVCGATLTSTQLAIASDLGLTAKIAALCPSGSNIETSLPSAATLTPAANQAPAPLPPAPTPDATTMQSTTIEATTTDKTPKKLTVIQKKYF